MDEQHYAHYAETGNKDLIFDFILNDPPNRDRLNLTIDCVPAGTQSLLDVGTGGGVFLYLLKQKRAEIQCLGLERTLELLKIAQGIFDARFIGGNANALPLSDQSVDVVSALEVIEHLPYSVYETALQEFARVARKWVIVSVPYREQRKFVRCPYCACRFNPYYHMHEFDEHTMHSLVPGFQLTRLEKVHIDWRPYLYNTVYNWYFRNTLPPFALCPSCGYRREEDEAAEKALMRLPTDSTATKGLKARLQQLYLHDFPMPRRKSYRWIIGVYERRAAP